MCSLPRRISNSCRPSLFFCGHFVSSSLLHMVSPTHADSNLSLAYFRISLSLTMRLISATRASLTHTVRVSPVIQLIGSPLTLFANQRVISVVGVVRISCRSAASVSQYSEVELCMAVSVGNVRLSMSTHPEIRDRSVLDDLSYTKSALQYRTWHKMYEMTY